jgi:hypothetical protein
MNFFINKKKIIQRKINCNYGVIKINNLNLVKEYLLKINKSINSMNLIVLDSNLRNFLSNFLSEKNFIFYRKNKNINGNCNLIISDNQTNLNLSDFYFDCVFLFIIDDLKLKKFKINFDFLWMFSINTDLIYFNDSIFVKKLLNKTNIFDFEKRIICNKSNNQIINKKINISILNYLPNLDLQLLFLNDEKIRKNKKKIINDYKLIFDHNDTCNICFNKRKLMKSKCCNSYICSECYLLNRKHYLKCPYCRYKYIDFNFNFNKHPKKCYIYITKVNLSKKIFDIDYSFYDKIKLCISNLIFECYVRKSLSKKKIVFFNVNELLIKKIINKYFSKLIKYKIVCYLPKFY